MPFTDKRTNKKRRITAPLARALQKCLFYLWKGLEDDGLPEVMPRDNFGPARNGPKPEHLDEDFSRFESQGLIEIRLKDWHPEYGRKKKHIILTDEGLSLAKNLWIESPTDYSRMALWARARTSTRNGT